MKKLIIYPLLAIQLIGCSTTSKTIDFSEPLINVYGKIISRQYIEFLELKDSKYKMTRYAYYIDLNKNIVIVRGVNSMLYEKNSDYINPRSYQTSINFKKQLSSLNVKYLNAIHPNFVNMDNKRKMQVLDSLVMLR
jgi:hypothetical protein